MDDLSEKGFARRLTFSSSCGRIETSNGMICGKKWKRMPRERLLV